MPLRIVLRFIAMVAFLFPAWPKAQLETGAVDRSEVVQTVRTFFNAFEASAHQSRLERQMTGGNNFIRGRSAFAEGLRIA